MQLAEVKEWVKHKGDTGETDSRIRIYCGKFLCGFAIPQKKTQLFRFESSDFYVVNIEERKNFTLEEIKFQVTLSLKEFIKQITVTNLKPTGNVRIKAD